MENQMLTMGGIIVASTTYIGFHSLEPIVYYQSLGICGLDMGNEEFISGILCRFA